MAAGAGSFPEWAAETGGVRRWLAVRWEWIQHRCWGWKARPWGERGRGAQRRQWSSPPWRRRTDPLSGLSAPGGEWPADPLYRGISEQRPGEWVRPVSPLFIPLICECEGEASIGIHQLTWTRSLEWAQIRLRGITYLPKIIWTVNCEAWSQTWLPLQNLNCAHCKESSESHAGWWQQGWGRFT